MTRPIKFRVWVPEFKEMHDVEKLEWDCDGRQLLEVTIYSAKRRHHYTFPLSHVELIEFTGFHDKNGNEIYEGNILKWGFGEHECTFVIKWSDYWGHFYHEILTQKNKNIISFDIRFYNSEESAEVIGNIYENQELLEKKGEKLK